MIRPIAYLAPIVGVFLIFSSPIISRADAIDDSAQDQLKAVNEQLNTFDSPQGSADGVDREFQGSGQADGTQKEFSNVPPRQEKMSTTLKEVLATDITPPSKPHGPSNVKSRINTFDLGYEIFYYRYQEPSYVDVYGNTEPDVKNRGPMQGAYVNYTYRPVAPNLFNNFLTNVYMLQARYDSSRDLEYTGIGEVKNKHDEIMEFRGLIGKDYFMGKNVRVTPYFGYGYRYLKDFGNGQYSIIDNLLYYGYDRKSHYNYLPLGGDIAVAMPHNWEIDFNAEYDILLYGYQKSFASDGNQFGADNADLVNQQHQGFGIRGSIKILKHLPLIDVYAEPYIRYWNIEQSDAVSQPINGNTGPWVEPNNNTIEIGSQFGIEF